MLSIRRHWVQLGSLSIDEAQTQFIEQVLQVCEPIESELEVVKFLIELYVLSILFHKCIIGIPTSNGHF